jgi:RNA polymerase sigma-70 factor, ECF subfamily
LQGREVRPWTRSGTSDTVVSLWMPSVSPPEPISSDVDSLLIERLRARDEGAFKMLLHRYHRAAVRLAGAHVKSEAVAEEVAQEAWLAVLSGVAGFEGRSSFRTWLFRIVVNAAKRRGAQEARSLPVSSLLEEAEECAELAVDPNRFNATGRWEGHWSSPPTPWNQPEERLLSAELRALIGQEIDALPSLQRQVITLRDIQECSAEETCEILGITEANQRVLLHRARSKVRRALEVHWQGAV